MKSHVVMVPCPAFGHITPMMQLAKQVAAIGFTVSLVLIKEQGGVAVKEGVRVEEEEGEGVRVVNFPLQLNSGHGSSSVKVLLQALEGLGPSLSSLLSRLRPPVSCIISDLILPATKEAAASLSIPRIAFLPHMITIYNIYRFLPHGLPSDGIVKEKKMISGIPGILRPLSTQDLPWISRMDDESEYFFKFMKRVVKGWEEGYVKWMLCNSIYDLESHAIDALLDLAGITMLPIGPLFLHSHANNNTLLTPTPTTLPTSSATSSNTIDATNNTSTTDIFGKLWTWSEDSSCLQWLDEQELKSVLFVSFGSITIFQQKQLDEIALALEESGRPFLWVVRPDLMDGTPVVLPHGFLDRIHGRQGFITSWVPQVSVLAHPATGGFLTHCGWNSTLESICLGVPMLAWPYFADQSMNRGYITEEWNVGLALDSMSNLDVHIVYRDELKSMIHRLMETNRKELHQNCQAWKQIASSAIGEGGSSYVNFNKFVNYLVSISDH